MAVDNGLTGYVPAQVRRDLYSGVDAMVEKHEIAPGLKKTFQIHHALPVSVANKSLLISKLYEGRMGEFQAKLNGKDNLIVLSTDGRAAEALGMNQHKSNHRDLRPDPMKKQSFIGNEIEESRDIHRTQRILVRRKASIMGNLTHDGVKNTSLTLWKEAA